MMEKKQKHWKTNIVYVERSNKVRDTTKNKCTHRDKPTENCINQIFLRTKWLDVIKNILWTKTTTKKKPPNELPNMKRTKPGEIVHEGLAQRFDGPGPAATDEGSKATIKLPHGWNRRSSPAATKACRVGPTWPCVAEKHRGRWTGSSSHLKKKVKLHNWDRCTECCSCFVNVFLWDILDISSIYQTFTVSRDFGFV